MRDAWRLAVGTFTAVRVAPPAAVTPRTLGTSLLLAPVVGVLLAVPWALAGVLTVHGLAPTSVVAVLALVTVALGTRAFHLDGLADLADGLTSGYGRERSLEVMRRGDVGPAGAAALVLVLALDVAALAACLGTALGTVLACVALVSSRLAPALVARRGTPPARSEGLGRAVAGSVAPRAVALAALATAVAGALAAAGPAATSGYASGATSGATSVAPLAAAGVAALTTVLALVAAEAVRRRAVTRLGGVTGDVLGAAVEVALAAALTVASVAATVLA